MLRTIGVFKELVPVTGLDRGTRSQKVTEIEEYESDGSVLWTVIARVFVIEKSPAWISIVSQISGAPMGSLYGSPDILSRDAKETLRRSVPAHVRYKLKMSCVSRRIYRSPVLVNLWQRR
jgi:hypothetical protein